MAVDPTSGVITVDDQIFDTYTLSDSAQVMRITMLQIITLSDFSITTLNNISESAQNASIPFYFSMSSRTERPAKA
jgi:hypothetical protein